MKSKKVLIIFIVFINIIAFSMIFLYISADHAKRTDVFLNQQVENLKTHYKIATKHFRITAESTVEMVKNDPVSLEILEKFLTASSDERGNLRQELYTRLENQYKRIKKLGVLQFHFMMPNNVTSLRMHKPERFDDNLTDFKYSYRHVNSTKKPIRGLEEGKTAPSFRDVRPLYSAKGVYLGCVDVAFAPEVLQDNILEVSDIYSNFIIHKSILKLTAWKRNDPETIYRQSIENDEYFEYTTADHDETFNANLLKNFKENILLKMKKEELFSIHSRFDGESYIIAFLPVKNIQNNVIAYLVSYSNSSGLKTLYRDFYILNFLILMVMILISYFSYKNVVARRDLKDEKEKFHQLSLYDTLTQLPNRLLFQEKIEQSLKESKRKNNKNALLFIDLDNFKNINDTYGHDVGDKLLIVVGQIIKGLIREEDTLARIGGDEFMIILEELNNAEDSAKISKKIIAALKEPIKVEKYKLYIGASIGISIFPDDSTNVTNLLKNADVAMYKAKEIGKNNFQFYSQEMMQNIIKKTNLEITLKEAIKNQEFLVYFQPQVNAQNNTLTGMEALVRWNHPQKGLVSPIEFVPLAEEIGLISEIDSLVMKSAMSQYVKWHKEGFKPGKLALNLSVKMIEQENCISNLKEIVKETNFQFSWLSLEVTESHIMNNPTAAIDVLQNLHNLGIEISIDDFGTGYSSLSYLKRLPIDRLKIDKSFIDGLPDDEEDVAISRTIIALAKNLNLKVIAEGVETQEQKDFLMENNCENIQGYFYSKPLPADEFKIILQNGFKS